MTGYADAFRRSLADPDGFWGDAAAAIDWYEQPAAALDAVGWERAGRDHLMP